MHSNQSSLSEFVSLAESLWSEYQANGPGRRPDGTRDRLLASYESAAPHCSGNNGDDLSVVCDLLRRCIERIEGLCFVTGESGLIPRRDLHEKLEAALSRLRQESQSQSSQPESPQE